MCVQCKVGVNVICAILFSWKVREPVPADALLLHVHLPGRAPAGGPRGPPSPLLPSPLPAHLSSRRAHLLSSRRVRRSGRHPFLARCGGKARGKARGRASSLNRYYTLLCIRRSGGPLRQSSPLVSPLPRIMNSPFTPQ